jgi:outer membrane protein insertion porin family
MSGQSGARDWLRRNAPGVCLFAGLLAAAGAHARPEGQHPGPAREQQPVISVRVVTEEGEPIAENPAELPLQPGQPFSAPAVRESIQTLYRTGLYQTIRAEAVPLDAGLRVDFVVAWNFFVNRVDVQGLQPPPTLARALTAMRLNLGEPFRQSGLEAALDRLRALLEEEGFYQAKVRYVLRPHAETRQMDVLVEVEPGERARLGTIALENQTEFADRWLLGKADLKPGQPLQAARLERAARRIREALVGEGHLSARVNIRRGTYHREKNLLPLTLEVIAGPRVRVEVEGARIRHRELRRLLPIYQEGSVDADLLREGARDIRDYLEGQGYFDSQVDYTVGGAEENGIQVITYRVERGPQRRLAGIGFEGNEFFSDALLLSLLRIRPAGFLDRGRFSTRLLNADREALQALYVANGFLQARVTADVIQNYGGREGDLFVRFHVQEGPPTIIGDVQILGNEALSDELLLDQIETLPGQFYSEANVQRARINILRLYFEQGYSNALFSYEVQPLDSGDRVRLIYRITEGQRRVVRRVLLDGYHHTRRGVIAREVLLKPGEPLSELRLVETQRRLYNLGIFRRVHIAPQNPEGSDPAKTVVVLVEEAPRYTMAYGGGFEVQRLGGGGERDPTGSDFRFSPRILFEISKANFGGRAHTLSFRSRASTLQGRALLSYLAPNFLANPSLSFVLTGLADKSRDVRTFSATRYEGSLQLNQQTSPITSLFYRYSFRRVLVDPDSLRVPPERIPLFSQPTKISSLGATWVRDTRQENPADPIQGTYNNVDLSVAIKAFGSSTSFVRLFYQNSSFHPLGRRLVLARSMRVGLQEPLGDTRTTDIPLPERFFAGGGTSLRGFGLNQAGPRDPDTGFPIGGLALLVFNHELRFPMRLPWLGGRVGGALFYDAGNVFERANRITLRSTPRVPSDLNYFSHTVGFGFRYQTPIGPVRLDLAYQLNAAEFSRVENGTPRLERLPRFQFFFNIGPIF